MNLLFAAWNPMIDNAFYVFMTLILIVVIFLIFRGILLWYWKINTIVINQDKQTELLEKIVTLLENEKK